MEIYRDNGQSLIAVSAADETVDSILQHLADHPRVTTRSPFSVWIMGGRGEVFLRYASDRWQQRRQIVTTEGVERGDWQ